MTGLRSAFAGRIGCEVLFDEPLARYTTYRIGGPATALVLPRASDDIGRALQIAGEIGMPWLILGLGSNILIADQGVDGMVIRLGKGLDHVRREGPERSRWTIGAGLPTPLLARQSAREGHAGVQRLIGVPGTVGGGVFMNAGAHGQDFSQVIRAIEVMDSDGDVRTLQGTEIAWRYRSSGLDHLVVLTATMDLTPGDPDQTRRELDHYLRKRKEGTPFDQPCCGSVFRNPVGPVPGEGGETRTAGQLIDACGLKGFAVGGAQVSPQHANYIVNTGTGTAADVRAVIDTVRQRVTDRFGVELQLEVKLIGFLN